MKREVKSGGSWPLGSFFASLPRLLQLYTPPFRCTHTYTQHSLFALVAFNLLLLLLVVTMASVVGARTLLLLFCNLPTPSHYTFFHTTMCTHSHFPSSASSSSRFFSTTNICQANLHPLLSLHTPCTHTYLSLFFAIFLFSDF